MARNFFDLKRQEADLVGFASHAIVSEVVQHTIPSVELTARAMEQPWTCSLGDVA